jgi:hypothetical protein
MKRKSAGIVAMTAEATLTRAALASTGWRRRRSVVEKQAVAIDKD